MDNAEAIRQLDAMHGRDPEVNHAIADDILLDLVDPNVAEAWRRARDRVGFWYA